MELSPMLKNFCIRAVSGAILVVVLLAAVLFNFHTKYAILLLLSVVSIYELLNLLKSKQFKPFVWFAVVTAILVAALFYLEKVELLSMPLFWLVIPLIVGRFTFEIFRKNDFPIQNIALELFALLYIFAPMLMLMQLSGELVATLFLMVWSNDVGAYVIGVLFGRHKLWPEISPKKSWEGFWGGFVVTIVIAILIGVYYFGHNPYQWGLIGAFVSISAVMGDFFESLIKRKLGVKDSGDTIPGHGGFLDRFDALFFAAPLFFLIISIAHAVGNF